MNQLPSREEVQAALAAKSLRHYVRQAWPIVEPGTPFVSGWHLDAIADHLEAVSRGEIRKLLINMPPRHMKSLAVSVFWPTWEWIEHPELRWLTSSYALNLAIRDCLKSRRIIKSPWYQARWGDRVKLTDDQDQKSRYENTARGYRMAASVDSAATGEGGDRIIADDPHSVREAQSAIEREAAITWWRETMSTRGNDPKTVARVIVMQRAHERDLSAHVLAEGGWDHLCLPAEYEPKRQIQATGINWSDPRSESGELLWPERFGRAELEDLKTSLGSYGAAGQLQQRPAPAAGGMFKRAWFEIVDALPAKLRWVRCWDLAATEAQTGKDPDWTVGLKVGRDPDGIFYVGGMERLRGSPGQVKTMIKATASQDGKGCRIRLPQDPGQAGKSQAADFVRDLAGYDVAAKPISGSKETRARPASAQAEHSNIKLLRGDWNEAFLSEIEVFPAGAHDDIVDTLSDAVDELADAGESHATAQATATDYSSVVAPPLTPGAFTGAPWNRPGDGFNPIFQ